MVMVEPIPLKNGLEPLLEGVQARVKKDFHLPWQCSNVFKRQSVRVTPGTHKALTLLK